MTDLTVVLYLLFGIGSGLGGFFYCYEKINSNIHKNLDNSFELYERNDLWRNNTSRG